MTICGTASELKFSIMTTLSLQWFRADSRSAPSQWETALLCNDVSHWLGTNLESALWLYTSPGLGSCYPIIKILSIYKEWVCLYTDIIKYMIHCHDVSPRHPTMYHQGVVDDWQLGPHYLETGGCCNYMEWQGSFICMNQNCTVQLHINRINFLTISHNRHFIPWERGCIFSDYSLIYVLPSLSRCYVLYCIILDHVMINCIIHYNKISLLHTSHHQYWYHTTI